MMVSLHKNARTTPAVRRDIAASLESAAVLAVRYGVTEATFRTVQMLSAMVSKMAMGSFSFNGMDFTGNFW